MDISYTEMTSNLGFTEFRSINMCTKSEQWAY